MDYETNDSYSLKVIATDSKGVSKEQSLDFKVNDIEIAERSKSLSNQNLVGNMLLYAEPSDNKSRIYVPESIVTKTASERF